jgi:hypothetical protein
MGLFQRILSWFGVHVPVPASPSEAAAFKALALHSSSAPDQLLPESSPLVGHWGSKKNLGFELRVIREPDGRFHLTAEYQDHWTVEIRGPRLVMTDRGQVIAARVSLFSNKSPEFTNGSSPWELFILPKPGKEGVVELAAGPPGVKPMRVDLNPAQPANTPDPDD